MTHDSLPSYTQHVLTEQQLSYHHTIRFGPRYICLLVERDGQPLFFKQVLAPESINPFYNLTILAEAFERETKLLGWFNDQASELSLLIPRLLGTGRGDNPWYLREHIPGHAMSQGTSDFIFQPSFFELIEPETIVEGFTNLHQVGRKTADWLQTELGLGHYTLAEYLVSGADWQKTVRNRPHLTRYLEPMQAFLDGAQSVFDRFMNGDELAVIAHHEPYPSHIFVVDRNFGLIDWENVGWTNRVQDLSKIWIRSFAAPAWQERLKASMAAHGLFDDGGQQVWETELLLQSVANIGYLERAQIGTDAYRQQAVDFMTTTIGQILLP